MSVADNVAFGLSVRGEGKAVIATEVQRALDLVQLGKLGGRRPHQLSGGQRQRVALARAIVTKPRVLLLDEPLGALDKALRVDMQIELKRIQREIGITTIFVTHDQEEALTMSDRVAILNDGRLVQEGPPEEIYDRPKSEFAATFLGDANIFRGDSTGNGIRLPDGTAIAAGAGATLAAGAKASCAVRPERIRIATDAGVSDAANANDLIVGARIFAGNNQALQCRACRPDAEGHRAEHRCREAGRRAGCGAALVAGKYGVDRGGVGGAVASRERLQFLVAPLCPAGHLPRKWGDWQLRRRCPFFNTGNWRKR